MIISRTPFRISFVGGGTDLRSFYSKEYGQVLSTSIDKYMYVAVKRQSGIAEYKYRINWSKVEFRQTIDEIEHPIVREALRLLEIDFACEITTFADIPAKSGLGSSSSFAVGLLHALFALKGEMTTKYQLAEMACQIELDILHRTMGKQDQYAASYGDLNILTFNPDERVDVNPVLTLKKKKKNISDSLLLFHIKMHRDASEVLKSQVKNEDKNFELLLQMRNLVPKLTDSICEGDIEEFGRILNSNWQLKQNLSTKISSSLINNYYDRAIKAGAYGGKLLGAGGGGFLMFCINDKYRDDVKNALSELYCMNFGFDSDGTRITYYDQ